MSRGVRALLIVVVLVVVVVVLFTLVFPWFDRTFVTDPTMA